MFVPFPWNKISILEIGRKAGGKIPHFKYFKLSEAPTIRHRREQIIGSLSNHDNDGIKTPPNMHI